MILLMLMLHTFVPEDSNSQHLLDKQLAHYFPAWEMHFDSLVNGLRTSQGCLDLLNWYIDLDAQCEVYLSKILGLRYRGKYLGDYDQHITDHRFEPFFQINDRLRFLFTVTTHYYKGEDEVGVGCFLGTDYLNYLQLFVIAEDFDRNFSLKDVPPGPGRIVYSQHPIKVKADVNRYWESGHFTLAWEVSNRYRLGSTEPSTAWPRYYLEQGMHSYIRTRLWQDIGRIRLGGIVEFKHAEQYIQDTSQCLDESQYEVILEPMLAYSLSTKWQPHLYLSYNRKVQSDSLFFYSFGPESLFHYERNVYAYLIDVEFHPGGCFVWHVGMQRQFYYNNQPKEFTDRRLLLGFEYRYRNVWFYFVEAMEGDFPTPKWLHNHTYVQLMVTL